MLQSDISSFPSYFFHEKIQDIPNILCHEISLHHAVISETLLDSQELKVNVENKAKIVKKKGASLCLRRDDLTRL